MYAEADTWMFLETKSIKSVQNYDWHQINLFTRWLPQTKQLLIVLFDATPYLEERIPQVLAHPEKDHLADPFWVYSRLFTEVARFEDEAVWAMRDLVRHKEKEILPAGRPQPNYRYLHDVARHAIHVTETLDVIAETMSRVLAEHNAFKQRFLALPQAGGVTAPAVANQITFETVHRRLCFLQHVIVSLRHRSVSNDKRLQNELQLAFHLVAQHDAYVSVQIGRAAQSDSAAAKTIAFVTLAFLPPTFVSAIFSMSFFNFSSDSGWVVSEKLWVYWAFAVPIMLLSILAWYWCQGGSASAVLAWCRRWRSSRITGVSDQRQALQ